MEGIPVVGFAGYSGSGKTTVMEKVVEHLTNAGLRIAVLKHDGHDFNMDREGKDSWRYTKAGAVVSMITSATKTGLVEQRELSLHQALHRIRHVDLVMVEGYKRAPIPQIGISRAACGKGLPHPPDHYLAVVTDEKIETKVPVFALTDTEGVAQFIMRHMEDFTHFNQQGRAKMVDVGEKEVSRRVAVAGARVYVNPETYARIESGGMKKGDVLTVAQIAGVMGAKRTPDLIPMCHPIALHGIDLKLSMDSQRCCVDIQATVSCNGRTGVEMEALMAASTAALTVYDMCKAVQKDIVISDLRLLSKSGGVHGDYRRQEGTV